MEYHKPTELTREPNELIATYARSIEVLNIFDELELSQDRYFDTSQCCGCNDCACHAVCSCECGVFIG